MKLVDIVGSEAALRHLNNPEYNVVTASLDRTNFIQPICLWEMINLESRVTQVWNQSMEVQVKVTAENLQTGQPRDIATSHLVFVALDPKTRQKVSFPPYRPITLEDHRLARSADIRKEYRKREGKEAPFIPIDPQSDQPMVVSRVMTEADANAQSNVFGGIILDIIDEAGSKAAQKQAMTNMVVGVSQDRMSFIAPTFIGETVEAKAILTKTWKTSMEVQVEVDAINPNSQERRRVASSYLVYVRLGSNRRPAEVPPWSPKTELQKRRAEAADIRRRIRQEEEARSHQPLNPPSWWDKVQYRVREFFQQLAQKLKQLLG